jgi:arylsulfatase A-like enzyme
MLFSDAHSSSAVCTPSRYSILTGRYCWRSRLKEGVLGGFSLPLIEEGRATAASVLKSAGYDTACIGKWHLGLKWYTKDGKPKYSEGQGDDFESWNTETGFDIDYSHGFEQGPLSCGFDRFFGIAGSLDMPPYCFLEGDRCADIPTREKDVYYPQQRRGLMAENWDDKLCDYTFALKAVDFLKEQANKGSESPFFLYLPTAAPHRPCLPPDFMEGVSTAGDKGDMVAMFDWVVGQVVDTLKSSGQWENTLLFVTSDNGARRVCFNGEDYGHKPNGDLRGQKADIWEGGHREPLIVTWPGVVEAGSVCDQMVCLSDLTATCFELAGVERNEDAAPDSCSMLPLFLDGRGDYGRKNLVHHSFFGCFAVREGDWKLITTLGSGGFSEPVCEQPEEGGPQGQLYNVADDIEEKDNLWLKEPRIRQRLIELLDDLK